MKVAIYIRVSTHYQIDKDSLPLQKKELINYSKYILGTDNCIVFKDAGYSGKDTIRPGFQDMMSKVRNNEFTHILVWKIDRISRNLLDFATMYEEMKEHNITFISKNEQFDTSTAMGEAMLKIILVFAELERKLAAERVYATMLSRAEKGLWNGAPVPLGYKWSEQEQFPVVEPAESKTVEYIYNQYERLKSSSKVMVLLNKNNIGTKKGGKWTTKTVTDIIRNPFYKGTYRYNYRESGRGDIKDESEWIVLPNNHKAIIKEEQWNVCNRIMDKNAKKNTALFRKNVNIHLFSSLLLCNRCGKGFIANLDRPRKNGFQPSIYRCQSRLNKLPCTSTKMATDVKIAPFILQYISNLVKSQNVINNITTVEELEEHLLSSKVFKDVAGIEGLESVLVPRGNILLENEKEDNNVELEMLKQEEGRHLRALERLNKAYLYSDNSMPEKDYLIQRNEITNKINDINLKIKELHMKESPFNNDFLNAASFFILNNEFMNKKTVNYKKLVMSTDKQLIRDFLHLVIDKIYIDDNKVSAIRFKNGAVHEFVYNSC